jgi:hypothetical protein
MPITTVARTLLDCRVLRFPWDDVRYDPATVVSRVASLLRYSPASASLNASSSGSSIE